jgi:hypothetical protein
MNHARGFRRLGASFTHRRRRWRSNRRLNHRRSRGRCVHGHGLRRRRRSWRRRCRRGWRRLVQRLIGEDAASRCDHHGRRRHDHLPTRRLLAPLDAAVDFGAGADGANFRLGGRLRPVEFRDAHRLLPRINPRGRNGPGMSSFRRRLAPEPASVRFSLTPPCVRGRRVHRPGRVQSGPCGFAHCREPPRRWRRCGRLSDRTARSSGSRAPRAAGRASRRCR